MKCEECQAVLAEPVDGAPAERAGVHLSMPLSLCPECSAVHEMIEHEEDLFMHYRRDLSDTPEIWEAVQRRLAAEKIAIAAPAPFAPTRAAREWLTRLFQPVPAIGFASALLLLALFGGILWRTVLRQDMNNGDASVRVVQESEREIARSTTQAASDESLRGMARRQAEAEHRTGESSTQTNDSRVTNQSVATGSGGARRGQGIASAGRHTSPDANPSYAVSDERRVPVALPPSSVERAPRPEANLARADTSPAAATGIAFDLENGTGTVEFDSGAAHHVEQSQSLLRAFRNVEASAADAVAYEKQNSKRLLYRNMLLRQAAADKGDLPFEELLNNLEPLLLDITNLPPNPTAAEVNSIKERIQRKEMVAALQIYR
jgi:hypothetical protein